MRLNSRYYFDSALRPLPRRCCVRSPDGLQVTFVHISAYTEIRCSSIRRSGTNGEQSYPGPNGSRSNHGIHRKFEALLDALTDRRRRDALYFLRDQEVTDLASLATHLAAIEQNVPVAALRDDEISRVRTDLVHADLPALADAQ